MKKDQRDLLYEFNARHVKYLVIGGYAFSHYAEPRATKDLDLFIEATPENTEKVFAALAQFGAPLDGIGPKDFQDPDSFFQLGVAPNRIDILQHIDGVTFEEAWQSAVQGMAADDLPVNYISLEDLIRNKLTVGRLRDLADVEALREAKAANGHPQKPKQT